MNDDRDLAQRLDERLGDILMVLSDVATGDYEARLEVDLPEEDPIGALYRGINLMAESIREAHAQTALYQKDLEEQLKTIEQQRAAIRELSTPIMEVWEGVLCLPIVGVMDSARASEMTDALLRGVVEQRARCAIIDITGIEIMDTGTADHFLRMARAVSLLGAKCVVTGVNPGIAQTIVHMGVELSGLETHRSLRDALSRFIKPRVAKPHHTNGHTRRSTNGEQP